MRADRLGGRTPSTATRRHAHPAVFFLLSLPKGIPAAFIVVILPFLARRAGVPVATIATMVALGLSPKVCLVIGLVALRHVTAIAGRSLDGRSEELALAAPR